MKSLSHSKLVWQFWTGVWIRLRKNKESWENLSWWHQRVMASYSLRVSYGPRGRIPALSPANVPGTAWNSAQEMYRSLGLSRAPWALQCAALPSQTQPGSKECSKETAPTSCQRNPCQGPKPSRHRNMGKTSDTSPIKCCSMRRYRYHHRGLTAHTQLWQHWCYKVLTALGTSYSPKHWLSYSEQTFAFSSSSQEIREFSCLWPPLPSGSALGVFPT